MYIRDQHHEKQTKAHLKHIFKACAEAALSSHTSVANATVVAATTEVGIPTIVLPSPGARPNLSDDEDSPTTDSDRGESQLAQHQRRLGNSFHALINNH